ncbi:nucleolin 1 isoform X2 [Folsomia candida]|uniref:nucleolin 1 isoform X2 n=1 Tax=Folsomia candida TaxID=158441 RepID=UPI001605065D|nr:nucleolin 1 isoform X2 [Folsomia candida]
MPSLEKHRDSSACFFFLLTKIPPFSVLLLHSNSLHAPHHKSVSLPPAKRSQFSSLQYFRSFRKFYIFETPHQPVTPLFESVVSMGPKKAGGKGKGSKGPSKQPSEVGDMDLNINVEIDQVEEGGEIVASLPVQEEEAKSSSNNDGKSKGKGKTGEVPPQTEKKGTTMDAEVLVASATSSDENVEEDDEKDKTQIIASPKRKATVEDAAGPSESKKKKDDDGNLPSTKAKKGAKKGKSSKTGSVVSELGENASAGKANVNGTDKLVLGAIAQLEDILSDDENDSSKPVEANGASSAPEKMESEGSVEQSEESEDGALPTQAKPTRKVRGKPKTATTSALKEVKGNARKVKGAEPVRTNPRRNCKTDVSYKPGNESQEKAKLAGTSQEKPKAFRINKKNLKEKSAKSEEHESENEEREVEEAPKPKRSGKTTTAAKKQMPVAAAPAAKGRGKKK